MTRPEEQGPRGRRTTEEVYDRLRALILENRIAPGERLNIDALARDFGVSQTPIREAVRQLEGDQLVVKSPGKGYRTTSLLDLRQLRELFEFRLLVEVWATRSAAVNRLGNPSGKMGAEITAFESVMGAAGVGRAGAGGTGVDGSGADGAGVEDSGAGSTGVGDSGVDGSEAGGAAVNGSGADGSEVDGAGTGGSRDIRHELVRHDMCFHGHILEALDNEAVRKAYEQTHSHLHTFRLYAADADGRATVAEHRRISDAIERCDPDGAEEAMRAHLTAAFDRFAQAFDERGPQLRSPAVPRMYAGGPASGRLDG